MCGIVGVVSAYQNGFSSPEMEAFQRMLFLDTFRGWDSTGVFGADKHSNVGILKEASMAPVFMQNEAFKEWSRKVTQSGMFAVGHNRAATRGTIKDENAHPFWVENNIVLVQNGTYFGDHKHLKDTEVDTEAIAHVIHEEDDIQKALGRINSAYALVWYNVKERSLNMVRNHHRPLHIAYTASGAMLFASESETLDYAIQKAGWKITTDPYMLKDDVLVKMIFDEKGAHDTENIPITHAKSFPVQQHTGSRVVRGHGLNDDEEVGLGWKSRFPVVPTYVPPVSRPPFRGDDSPHSIKLQFFDVFPGKSNEYDLAKEDIEVVQREYLALTNARPKVIVETQDYFAANTNKNCQVWHVMATVLSPNQTILNKVALHWTLTNISESDIFEYATKESWFEAKLGNLIISKFGDRYIARAYCPEVKSITNKSQSES